MGAITEDRKLTENEKNLLRVFRREVLDVRDEILSEINQLRNEQAERHAQSLREEAEEFAALQEDVARHAYGLLGLLKKKKRK